MTREQYQDASVINNQIAHISNTLAYFENCGDYNPNNETVPSGLYLRFGRVGTCDTVRLTEGEAILIKGALELYKKKLERRFEEL